MDARIAQIRALCAEGLWKWAPFAERYWWAAPDYPDAGCFGTGYDSWGVQTNQKYLGTLAVLASGDAGNAPGAFPREQALQRFRQALNFSLASHRTGGYRCTDGTQWGRTWISGLGIERMMHGVERLAGTMTPEDRAGVAALLCDEADHQLGVEVGAGLWAREGRNKPESNIWNGAICTRAALDCPDHPHAGDWMRQAHRFFINGVSIPADAQDASVIAGQPVREWYAGANFFPHYALDHHGYLNVGYMVICLSNIAMLHYSILGRGQTPPASLYHHAADLWGVVRRLIAPNGRLLRIGGDTRIRYSYCQDYLIPTLVLAADLWDDGHALELLEGAVELVRAEQATNADGSFMGGRLREMIAASPYYYTRLEADKAVVLSMALLWLTARPIQPSTPAEDFEHSVAGGWAEPEHGGAMHRSPTRFVSWCWRAAELPQGLCLPPRDSHMAEWRENLAGEVRALGARGRRRLNGYRLDVFPGGFLTAGETLDGTDVVMAEGWKADISAYHRLVFAALPDDHTAILLERATLPPRRVYLQGWAGVKLEMPNDLFNGHLRRYAVEGGLRELGNQLGAREVVDLGSRWVNIDDRLGLIGLYGAESWQVLRRGERTGGWTYGNLLTDALCFGLNTEPTNLYGPATLMDGGCVILASADRQATRTLWAGGEAVPLSLSGAGSDLENCRTALVRGQDGCLYLLAANFGQTDAAPEIQAPPGRWTDLVAGVTLDGDRNLPLAIPAGGARLLRNV